MFLAVPTFFSGRAQDADEKKRLRRPIAMAVTESVLLVANRDSGTISVIDTDSLKVQSETTVSGRISDMAFHAGAGLVAVTDDAAGELITLALTKGTLREVQRFAVGHSPVSVRLTDDGNHATVALLWPRRLVFVDLAKKEQATQPAFLDLPFAPRRQVHVRGRSKVIVADSFGGRLAVIDLKARKIDSVRDLAVHNIRGLALDRQRKNLLVTHQMLHAQARPTQGDILTGNLITNTLRRFSLAKVLDPVADILQDERSYSLGDVERGAGDPAEVLESDAGHMLVALAGVDELGIGLPEQSRWTRLGVGRRPTALALDAARQRVYVANTFADSVAVVDLDAAKVTAEIKLGAMPELRPQERGEMLFFDARLSFEAWFSCQSCHPDGHTNGRLNDNFSDRSFGTPKRVLSLLGAKDTGPWAWNGQVPDLETQVRNSLKSTMQGPNPTKQQVDDLTAFLKTLAPPPALLQARGTMDADAHQRGRKVFSRQKCATCHAPPTYTSAKTYDVGLVDERGGNHFNPPSLRGLSQAGPYFHDSRAQTLEDVFHRHRHQLAPEVSAGEINDLLTYLRGL